MRITWRAALRNPEAAARGVDALGPGKKEQRVGRRERRGSGGGERKYSGEAAPGATREAGTRVPPRALGETEKDHLWLGPGSLKPFLGRWSLLALRLESVDAAG